MNHPLIDELQLQITRRSIGNLLIWMLPVAAGLFLISKFASTRIVYAIATVALVIWLSMLIRAVRSVDSATVVRRLDASLPSIEDSADLLLAFDATPTALQALQRQRIVARLESSPLPDLRPAWAPRSAILSTGVLLVLASLFWILPKIRTEKGVTASVSASTEPVARETVIRSIQLDVAPPSYTGLAARSESALDAKVAEGSKLTWRIQFGPDPGAAKLAFHDGSEIPLQRKDGDWTAEMTLAQSTLYRIALESAPPLAKDPLYRLDAIVDAPPEIEVIAPDKTLTVLDAGQRTWPLTFEVNDDYGVADASLLITLAQGSGEQVTVSERSERLRADSGKDLRHRRFRRALDLGSVGFAAGDDLIVRLVVNDNRKPSANITRSASYILRWPPDLASESEGVDGIVQKVLPAYFRSQRQIIIDTEALIVERPKLGADQLLSRSDTIGVDQKILRLRYGQFLGEEFESGAAEHHAETGKEDEKASQQDALTDDHGHTDAASSTTGFGNESNILAEYGHTHDHAEAATLLDPETKKILKSALSEMWQAELHLRQGEPAKALSFENRALIFIKQVQQSTRIYLARVGLELPPVDESRRLTGERKDVRDPRGFLVASNRDEKILSDMYQSLASNASADLASFDTWLRANKSSVPDVLSLITAVDEVRHSPDCIECRNRLLDQVWRALPSPPTETRLRVAPDQMGRDYLDRLQEQRTP